jgi:hypothetical protein
VRNFADAVFRMEAGQRLEDVAAVLAALKEMLGAPGLEQLRRAFNQWIKALLRRRAVPPMIEEINAIHDIFEEFAMLTETQETWFDYAMEKGLLQGLQKGREEGREEGELKILTRLLTRRFGPLPEWAAIRLRNADIAQLEAWGDAILEAKSLADVLGPAGGH